jgi:hypothetical protein
MANTGNKSKCAGIKRPQFLGCFNNAIYCIISFQQYPVTHLTASQNTINYKRPVRLKVERFAVNVPEEGRGEFGDFRGHRRMVEVSVSWEVSASLKKF